MAEGLMDSLSKKFNAAGKAIFNKHTLIHLGLMAVFMTLPMVAMAAPAGAATLGDLAVQTGHMYGTMFTEGIKALPVGADMISNTLSGNFAANTMQMGAMPGMDHAVSAAVGGHGATTGAMAMPTDGGASAISGHGAMAAADPSVTQAFTSRSEWFASLPPADQAYFQQQADFFGKPLEEVTRGWADGRGGIVPEKW